MSCRNLHQFIILRHLVYCRYVVTKNQDLVSAHFYKFKQEASEFAGEYKYFTSR